MDAICPQISSRTCSKHTLEPNQSSKAVPINVINDGIAEGDESFVVELCKLEDIKRKVYFSSSYQATVTIRDDDSEPHWLLLTCTENSFFLSYSPSRFDWFYSTTFSRRWREGRCDSVCRQGRPDWTTSCRSHSHYGNGRRSNTRYIRAYMSHLLKNVPHTYLTAM